MTVSPSPGACNIGPAELARRRRAAILATGLTIVAAGVLLWSGVAPIVRLAIFPLAAAAAVTWLQVIRRFCVAFGVAGIRNFGALGSADIVLDRSARAADRGTALRMIAEGSLYGLIVTALVLLLPV